MRFVRGDRIRLSQTLYPSGTKRNLEKSQFVHCFELEEISAVNQNNEVFENLEYFGFCHLLELKKFTWGGPEQRMPIQNVRRLDLFDNRWLKNITWIMHLP